jgi:purine-binding chemotaxis protein CheW
LSRAESLRQVFDEGFAHAPLLALERNDGLIALRLGGDPYAVRITEVAELLKGRTVVSMPSRRADFLGLARLRGGIISVYSLGGLLGRVGPTEEARWLLLSAAAHSVAFAVEDFEGYLGVAPSDILPSPSGVGRAHLTEVARVNQVHRPIISLRSILAGLETGQGPVAV